MKFIDEVEVEVLGGDGGDGCVAFRREKYVPRGGPSGGDGGRGGHVVLRADPGLTTLLELRHRPLLRAERGEHGRGKEQYGRGGADLVVKVPVGTLVADAETHAAIADLTRPGDEAVVGRGGRGGLGNMHFATSTRQTPRFAQPGEKGEHRRLQLELRLLADVGLLGFPNAGKSSLVAALSAARPKIADYPFTTLVPQLGVVRVDVDTSFVLADIPGLIEGAHRGAGLGSRFLRHLSRTRLLVHVLDLSPDTGRDPLRDFEILCDELQRADPALARIPQIVAANKIDLVEARMQLPEIERVLGERGIDVLGISAAARIGLDELVRRIAGELARLRPLVEPPTAPPMEAAASGEPTPSTLPSVPESGGSDG